MTAPLPALPIEASPWDQALYAFLVEKGNRCGSRRAVESVQPDALALLREHDPEPGDTSGGPGLRPRHRTLGQTPSPVTIAARIACLSSYFRFLVRMGMVAPNPCDLVERPRVSPPPHAATRPTRSAALARYARPEGNRGHIDANLEYYLTL